MNFSKRAIISVKRRPFKSMTFLFLVTILGVLTAGSITVRQAIDNTNANLRRRMPAIVTVRAFVDWEEYQWIYDETGIWPETEQVLPTPEFIREIAALPQVRYYDFSIDLGWWSVSSTDLQAWHDPNFPLFGWDYDEDTGTFLRPRGVSSTNFVEMREGVFELVEGRGFTADELENIYEVTPVLISTGLAEANHLSIGSTFESRVIIWDREYVGNGESREDRELPPIIDMSFPLKVIGIFDPMLPEIAGDIDMDEAFQLNRQMNDAHRRIYLPNMIAEEMFDARIYGEIAAGFDVVTDVYLHSFFVLGDLDDHVDFVQAVENFDGEWVVYDLSAGFAEISTSMNSISEIADFVLLGAISATVLIISLLVLLFLRDRKHEIGVYLAMGDKKKNIIMQIVAELLPIAVIGLTISLLIGNIVAGQLSQDMLRQDLLESQIDATVQTTATPLEELGYRFEISMEEMLASYEISLDPTIVFMFYGVGLGTVLISTLVPIIFAVKVDPKKLLMEDKV